jgi:hypothetical protein
VGFNATRRYRDDKRNDIWLLVVAVVVLGAGLLWGFGSSDARPQAARFDSRPGRGRSLHCARSVRAWTSRPCTAAPSIPSTWPVATSRRRARRAARGRPPRDDGCELVARNWRLTAGELRGELDLIAVDPAPGASSSAR